VVVALVCAAMLIAVPLYLWRKPSTKSTVTQALASASGSAGPQLAPKAPAPAAAPAAPPPRLTLGAVQKVRCGARPSATNEGALCDTLGPFEEALKKAVLSTEECAPKAKVKGSINFVLTIDFARKKLHVFPGASGEWHGKVARRATSCVGNAIKISDWNIPHQFHYYAIAVLATYAAPADVALPAPASSGLTPPPTGPTLPTFE
jgi:hypothetical protein